MFADSVFAQSKFIGDVARHEKFVRAGQRDVVTRDALLAGWLMVNQDKQWRLRYCEVKAASFEHSETTWLETLPLNHQVRVKMLPLPEGSRRHVSANDTCCIQLIDDNKRKTLVSIICSQEESVELRRMVENVRDGMHEELNPRVRFCSVYKYGTFGAAPTAVLLRFCRRQA